MKLSWLVLLLSGCHVGGGLYRADVRTMFSELTFPEKAPGAPRAADVDMQMYAVAQLELLTAWDDPHAVARCLDAVTEPLLRDAALQIEAAPLSSTDPARAFARTLCGETLNERDFALFAFSFGRYAVDVRATARGTTASPEEASLLVNAAISSIGRIATLLRATPMDARTSSNTNHPSLALSGGAANGAFTAGYLYELLLDRELALTQLPPTDIAAADAQSRFGAVVGTSVGSLQTQLVDLFFSNGGIPAFGGGFFTRTPDYGNYPPPDVSGTRPLQGFVLDALYRSFVTVDEPLLVCAENAPATALVGVLAESRPNFMRFDPMSRNIIDPILVGATPQMSMNGVLTSLVSVETMQNQLLGLDERACAALPAGAPSSGFLAKDTQAYCRSSGVMASVVLPFFARPLAHAYSGLRPHGEAGAWLDGGLRSTLPVYRALRMSRPREDDKRKKLRVLALSTLRAEGLPSNFPKSVPDVALNAIGQMSSQTIANEVVMAEWFAAHRDQSYTAYRVAGHTEKVAPSIENSDAVHAVFVPTDAASGLVAEAGYAFDGYVMRGLFTWGRYMAIRDLLGIDPDGRHQPDRRLSLRLDWEQVADGMSYSASAHLPEVTNLLKAYEPSEVRRTREERFARGRARIREQLPLCGELGSTIDLQNAPAYFYP